jgi:hypothetical protein
VNFLQLCQRTREKAGITGTTATPTTVVGQVGELGRVVNWVNEAWEEIQNLHNTWGWMRGSFSFNCVAGTDAYVPASAPVSLAAFAEWHADTLRCYLTATGVSDEQFMAEWTYPLFRDYYAFGNAVSGRPQHFAVRPSDKALLLGPNPDAVYTIRGEYQKSATLMSADTDEPGLPSQFHMLIVHGALMKYADYENAPEVLAAASRNYYNMLTRLSQDQLPTIGFGMPLA